MNLTLQYKYLISSALLAMKILLIYTFKHIEVGFLLCGVCVQGVSLSKYIRAYNKGPAIEIEFSKCSRHIPTELAHPGQLMKFRRHMSFRKDLNVANQMP